MAEVKGKTEVKGSKAQGKAQDTKSTVAKPQRRNGGKSDFVEVTVDMEPGKVLELDSEGKDLQFDFEDRFLELDSEQVRELSYENRRRYVLTKEAHRAYVKQQEDPTRGRLKVKGPTREIKLLGGNAKNRLDAINNHVGKGKHGSWKRPDEFDSALDEGYRPVRVKGGDGKEKILKIVEKGEAELIAMEIDQKAVDDHVRSMSLKSRERKGQIIDQFKQKVDEVSVVVRKKTGERVIVRGPDGEAL